jgi:hypothetical protein
MVKTSRHLVAIRVGSVLAALVGFIIGIAIHPVAYQFWFPIVTLPLVLSGFHSWSSRSQIASFLFIVLVTLSITACATYLANTIHSNIIDTNEWDFLTFWLDGRVASRGLNFYDPQHYHQLAESIRTSGEFLQEILNVGFRYPPPTMFLFLPLGFLELQTALQFWYAFHVLIFLVLVFVLWKAVLQNRTRGGLILSAVLLIVLRPTMQTFGFAQTNFLVLLFFLLFWINRSTFTGGVFLALGVLTKPIVAVFAIFLIARWKWKPMVSMVLTGLAFSVVSAIVFGFHTFVSYFTEYPPGKMPKFVFSESVNQSLNATMLRLGEVAPESVSLIFSRGVILLIIAVMVIATGWLASMMGEDGEEMALATTLVLALLIYPGTLHHYGVLMSVPLLWMWVRRANLGMSATAVAGFVTAMYALMGAWQGRFLFVATISTWAVLTVIGYLEVYGRRIGPDVVAHKVHN